MSERHMKIEHAKLSHDSHIVNFFGVHNRAFKTVIYAYATHSGEVLKQGKWMCVFGEG